MIKLILFISVFLLNSSVLMAGTVIEIQDEDTMTTVISDGRQVRINTADGEYVIIDYINHGVKFVSPKENQVLLLGAGVISRSSEVTKVHTRLKNMGAGDNIAGYATQKFSYRANGKPCGIIYGSTQAYQVKGMKALMGAIQAMMEKQQAALGGFAYMVDDCTLADLALGDHTKFIGVPMRIIENGIVNSEIKSIRLNVNLPADTFVIPASYKTISMQQTSMQQQVQQYTSQTQ